MKTTTTLLMSRSSSKSRMKLTEKTKTKRCLWIWTNSTTRRNSYFCNTSRMSTRSIQISSPSLKNTWTRSFNRRTSSNFATRFAFFSSPRTTVRPKTKRLKTSRLRVASSRLRMKSTKRGISSSPSHRYRWCSHTNKKLAVALKSKSNRKLSPSLQDRNHSLPPKHCSPLRLRSK
jgi:hypothetical protein